MASSAVDAMSGIARYFDSLFHVAEWIVAPFRCADVSYDLTINAPPVYSTRQLSYNGGMLLEFNQRGVPTMFWTPIGMYKIVGGGVAKTERGRTVVKESFARIRQRFGLYKLTHHERLYALGNDLDNKALRTPRFRKGASTEQQCQKIWAQVTREMFRSYVYC